MQIDLGGAEFSRWFSRIKLRRAAPLLFVAAFLAANVLADTAPPWQAARQEAADAAKLGHFNRAVTILRSAIASVTQQSVEAVTLWNELGAVQHSARDPEAEPDFNRALALNATLREPDLLQTAIALNNLGTIAGERHEAVRGEALIRHALELLQTANQDKAENAAVVRGNLALTLQQGGRFAEAADLYSRALPGIEKWFGADSLEYARVLSNKVLLDLQTGNYGEAVSTAKLAVEIEGKLPFVSPADLALACNNLGLAVSESGDSRSADSVLRRAVKLEESLTGNSEQLVASLNNLASVEEKLGNLELAGNAAWRALRLLDSGRPSDGLTRAAVWNSLGRIAVDGRNFKQGRSFYENASRVLRNETGAGRVRYAATLSNLAALESAAGHHKKSAAFFREALEIDRQFLGENHPEVASDLSNLATQIFYEKHFAEALALYGQARVILADRLGPGNSQVARTWRNMAVTYYTAKQFAESANAYSRALQILQQNSSETDPNRATWLREYANALRKDQRFGEAEAAETRALGIEVRDTLASQKHEQPVPVSPRESGKT